MNRQSSGSPSVERFQIVELLGAGGMGQVYRARDTVLDREVALKVLRGRDERDLERMVREVRGQAKVTHPHVCKVYEVSGEGEKPYIAMQLVDGPTLAAAGENLSRVEIVEILAKVARAVHAAHEAGLVHRDLKPSNILLEHRPARGWHPYVMDFGLVLIEDAPALTSTGAVLGTAAYMAPEQARGDRQVIDSRTDVYSLGAILYELLAGRPLFEGSNPVEVLVASLSQDPVPLSSVAPGVPADLAAVVGKCIAKDPALRYSQARELAEDLERYLAGEPVRAQPPSLFYRWSKQVRKHRTVAALIALVVVLAVSGTIKYTIDLRSERAEAVTARDEAEEVSSFLIEIFEISDPDQQAGDLVTARELLDRAAQRVEAQDGIQAASRARLMTTIGRIYARLGLYKQSLPILEEALRVHDDADESEGSELASRLSLIGEVYLKIGNFEDAQSSFERCLELREQSGAEDKWMAEILGNLGFLHLSLGNETRAEPLLLRSAELAENHDGPLDSWMPDSFHDLAMLYYRQGRMEEAEARWQQALRLSRSVWGETHLRNTSILNGLAVVHHSKGEMDEAESSFREILEIREQQLGGNNDRVATSAGNLGVLYLLQGKLDQAEQLFRKALQIRLEVYGPDHADVGRSYGDLALVALRQGRLVEAETGLRKSLRIWDAMVADDHEKENVLEGLAQVLRDRQEFDEAIVYYERTLAVLEHTRGADHEDIRRVRTDYASVLRESGREARALEIEAGGLEESGND